MAETNEKIKAVLSNILSFCVKHDDAPCSASTHLDTAICLLVELCPEYETHDNEKNEIISDAIENISMLLGKNNG
jgi:hypothetical protein